MCFVKVGIVVSGVRPQKITYKKKKKNKEIYQEKHFYVRKQVIQKKKR